VKGLTNHAPFSLLLSRPQKTATARAKPPAHTFHGIAKSKKQDFNWNSMHNA